MIHGEWKAATIADEATTSSEVDLGRPYENLMVIGTALDSAQLSIQVAEKTGGTFQDLYMILSNDGTSAQVITDAGTSALTYMMPIGGFQFIKIKASAAQNGGPRLIRVMGVRS